MIEILATGALSTVQDPGRTAYRRFGVGTAGAMDRLALAIGNTLVDNPADAAGIEIPVLPFKVQFRQPIAFAVTGADCAMQLDGKPLLPWWRYQAEAGEILTLGGDGQGFSAGARSYVNLAGGVDVPLVLGSRSTQLRGHFGGHQGRALVAGDRLSTGPVREPPGLPGSASSQGSAAGFGVVPPSVALTGNDFFAGPATESVPSTAVRVLPAAEYDFFNAESTNRLWHADWKITAQSDRYGYRLFGPALALKQSLETRSHGVVPGVIQVPPGGQPIIQMQDAQPSGGYPKIGTVIEADLWRLAQAPAGSRVRFVKTTYSDALAANLATAVYLAKVHRLIATYRGLHV